MKDLNKYVLLVMKWLNDKDSVTQQELIDNRADADAYAAYAAAYAAAYLMLLMMLKNGSVNTSSAQVITSKIILTL